jgi:hypothetical protein
MTDLHGIGERVDLALDDTESVATGEMELRVDGLDDPARHAALRRRLTDVLRDPALTPSKHPRRAAPEGIQVGLVGPSLDPRRQAQIQDDITALIAGDEELAARAAGGAQATCICFSDVPGDRIGLKAPPYPWFDAAGAFVSPPGTSGPWIIAVKLDTPGWCWAALTLSDGAAANPPVPKSQVVIGLSNATSWSKEIWADNLCSGRTASVFQSGTSSTVQRMRLDAPQCWAGADTIVFRKPGFLGIWHDVGYFPPEFFWAAFGGTVADFRWVFD